MKIMIGALAIFYIFMIDGMPILAGDQIQYLTLGKSIASGQGYTEIWSPANQLHTKFPFVYPFILSLCIRFFGYNFYVMRFLNVIFAVLLLAAAYHILKKFAGPPVAVGVIILTGLSYKFIYSITHTYSEITYTLFSFFALIWMDKYFSEKKAPPSLLIASAAFILAAIFTRLAGAAFIIAAVLFIFLEKRRVAPAALAILTAIPLVGWLFFNYLSKKAQGLDYMTLIASINDPSTLGAPMGFLEVLGRNVYSYIFYSIPYTISGIQFQHRAWSAVILSAIFLTGLIRSFTKKRGVVEYYFISYMALITLYWYSMYSGSRFLVPLAPFIFYYFITGCGSILERLKIEYLFRRKAIYVVTILIVAASAARLVLLYNNKEVYQDYTAAQAKDFLAMADWAGKNTEKASVFAGINSPDIYFYSGRKTVSIPIRVFDPKEALDFLRKNRVKYIVRSSLYSDKLNGPYLDPIFGISKGTLRFKEIYKNNSSAIYSVTG